MHSLMWATAAVTLSVRAAALSSGHRVLRLNAAVTSPADPPVRSAHSALSEADAVAFAALGDACVDSLRDKRQIDEVVAQFARASPRTPVETCLEKKHGLASFLKGDRRSARDATARRRAKARLGVVASSSVEIGKVEVRGPFRSVVSRVPP